MAKVILFSAGVVLHPSFDRMQALIFGFHGDAYPSDLEIAFGERIGRLAAGTSVSKGATPWTLFGSLLRGAKQCKAKLSQPTEIKIFLSEVRHEC
jgi:hypothetical protein